MITLGSLFDGIGGFPLSGQRVGITSIWSSEIEPFPIKVSEIRFPEMKQLGDITKINGAEIEPVDIVTGGSPCQDMSIAGKRAGLAGERSGLFMEQIRIIKELRQEDAKRSGTTRSIRPRFMVWENVPGAFSSNFGEDFWAVLEETAKIANETITIPEPEKKWDKKANRWRYIWKTAGCIMGDGWSIAWRVLDAQYWGVPQRRRRIFLVADFGGQSAPEVLFKRKGLSRHIAESRETRQGITSDIERSVNATILDMTHANDVIRDCGKIVPTLQSRMGTGGNQVPLVQTTYCIQGNCIDRADTASCNGKGWKENVSYTLNTVDRPAVTQILPFNATQITSPKNGNNPKYGDPCHPLCATDYAPHIVIKTYGADLSQKAEGICFKEEKATCVNTGTHGGHGNNVVTYSMQHSDEFKQSDKACTQSRRQYKDSTDLIVASIDCRNMYENIEKSGTLQSKSTGGTSLNYQNPVRIGYSVRRLTPLECERLQGFPDGWTNIEWELPIKVGKNPKRKDIPTAVRKQKATDSARYKALGNSVAVCCPEYVLEGIKEVLENSGA